MALGRKPGGGSRKGLPNEATAAVREATSIFAEANVGKLQEWLDQLAKKEPARAANLLLPVLE